MRKYIKSYYILYVLFISATNINNQEILGFNYLVLKRDTIQKIPFFYLYLVQPHTMKVSTPLEIDRITDHLSADSTVQP